MNALDIRRKLLKLSLKAAQLQGVLNADREQQAALLLEVSQAKGRGDLAEEIGTVFDALQTRAHQRSVGAFENLLSAVLNDVLPGEGVVKLMAEYKNNSTYLDFMLEKNGGLEDVLEGNGGAVTNVLCAGLRYAALSRTANRRLMVLDEPDCWLAPARIPFFANVISQVSRDMETQTFFVTHHDPALFEGVVNLVRFFEDADGKVQAHALAPLVQDWENDEQVGIRAIELINVRRHEHTLVPCFPGATAYIGDNNLGKSAAIVTALKTVAYGESDDSMIRHGCTEGRVIIHLEGKQRLEWSRSTKRAPTVLFRLYKGEELVAEGRPRARNQAPEWVTDILGVSRVDDLDLQIGSQKNPVFLLNDSAPRRAQILSVGRESSHLRAYMKKYEELKTQDRETVKAGELTLARLNAKLTYLERVEPLVQELQCQTAQGEQLLADLERLEALTKMGARLTALSASVQVLTAQADVLARIPTPPTLHDTSLLASLATKISRGQLAAAAPAVPDLPVCPVLAETSALARLTARIEAGQVLKALPAVPALPLVPVLADVTRIVALGQRIRTATTALAVAPSLVPIPPVPALHELRVLERVVGQLARSQEASAQALTESLQTQAQFETAQQELLELQDQLGGECPLCGNAFAHPHTHTQAANHVH